MNLLPTRFRHAPVPPPPVTRWLVFDHLPSGHERRRLLAGDTIEGTLFDGSLPPWPYTVFPTPCWVFGLGGGEVVEITGVL